MTHLCLTPARIAAMISLAFLGACGDDSGDGGTSTGPVAVATVEVTAPSTSLTSLGATVQLQAVAKDASGNTLGGKSFTWASSDGTIATVDANGLVTAVANGSATISATTDGVSGSATVTVTVDPQNEAPTVTLSAPAAGSSFTSGDVISFEGSATDPEDGALSGSSLAWSSSLDGEIGTGTSFTRSDLSVGTHTITLTATDSKGASGMATITITVDSPSGQRAFVDRTDQVSGSQIHIMYVLPSDGIDRSLDLDGTLLNTVGSFQNWLAGQTGGRNLRVDTFDGQLDITFVRLNRSDAAMTSYGAFVRDSIDKDLALAGFNNPNKIYTVYYDGGSTFSCGGGAWPPALPGQVAALYLQGAPPGAPSCNTNAFASSSTAAPGYLEFAMLHEVMHTMGFIDVNAPNHTLSGHVSDSPTDLMYAGTLPWAPSVLDFGGDDYFGGSLPAGVLDLAASPYLLP